MVNSVCSLLKELYGRRCRSSLPKLCALKVNIFTITVTVENIKGEKKHTIWLAFRSLDSQCLVTHHCIHVLN